MIVVTHEMGFAKEICDQIVFMAEGQIVEVAPPKEFFLLLNLNVQKHFYQKVLNHSTSIILDKKEALIQ